MDSIHVKSGKTLETCILRTEHKINMLKVVLDVSNPIETDFSGKKINAVPNSVLKIEF